MSCMRTWLPGGCTPSLTALPYTHTPCPAAGAGRHTPRSRVSNENLLDPRQSCGPTEVQYCVRPTEVQYCVPDGGGQVLPTFMDRGVEGQVLYPGVNNARLLCVLLGGGR